MPLFDRYLLKEIIRPFILGVLGFTAMLSGTSILFALVGDIIRNGIPWSTGLIMFCLRVPSIVVFSFPMATILAVLLALGRLSGDNEITALRAGGIGIDRIALPILAFGLAVSFATIVFNEWVVPQATFHEHEIYFSVTKQKHPTIRKNVNITEYDGEGRPKRIINALEAEGTTMHQVTVIEYENGVMSQITQADAAMFDPRSGWSFINGVMHRFIPKDRHRMLVIDFQKEKLNFQIDPSNLLGREKSPEEMNASELGHYIRQKQQLGENVNQLRMSFHQKFAIPFACLILALIGCPMAMRHHRTSNAVSVGLALGIIVFYYIATSVSMGIGLTGTLPAVVAAWLPNVLVAGIGSFLLWKAAR